jgi:UDP-glucose 4-epimerase
MNNHCLIIGGGGFIGRNLTQFLLNSGFFVRIFDRNDDDLKSLDQQWRSQLDFVNGDVKDSQKLIESTIGIDTLIWLVHTSVPSTSMENVEQDLISNISPLINFFEKLHGIVTIKKFIYISSGGTIYGNNIYSQPIHEEYFKNPISSYGLTKLVAEEYISFFLNSFNINGFILRPSNVYGEYQNLKNPQGIIGHAFKSIMKRESLPLYGDGSVVRDFLYVSDLSRLIYKCIEYDSDIKRKIIINAGSGVGYSISDVVERISSIAGSKIKILKMPERNFDCSYNVLNIDKAKEIFSWEPEVSLDNGLKNVWNWIKNTNNV